MTPDQYADAIYELSQTPELLQQLILDVAEQRLDDAPAAEWSARTLLAHLLSVERQVYRVRLARMLTEDTPAVANFDETEWANRYAEQPLELGSKLVTDFTVQRAASVRMLENMRAVEWDRTALHPEYGIISAAWLLEHWLNHDRTHLKQLTSVLEAFGN